MATIAVNQAIGSAVIGTVTIPAGAAHLLVTYPAWSQAARILVVNADISYDGGLTWIRLVTQNPRSGGFTGTSGWVADMPAMCTCGSTYLIGDVNASRSAEHSSIALKAGTTIFQLRQLVSAKDATKVLADYKTRIVTDTLGRDIDEQFIERTFHDPTLTPSLIDRRIRFTAIVTGGTVVTTLTWLTV